MHSNFSYGLNLVIILTTLSQIASYGSAMKRGPHHPRSERSSDRKVDQHLTHEEHRIEDDLREMGIDVNPDNMSEEEKTFYYFKIHDSDNNNALDGLEMLHAAMHQDTHNDKAEHDDGAAKNSTNELNHIIEVIDEFLQIADINKDGFLHYPEYIRAVNGIDTNNNNNNK